MKNRLQNTLISSLVLIVITIGCSPLSRTTSPDPATAAGPAFTPSPAELAAGTLSPQKNPAPTQEPTPTVYPPIFDPAAISDNREWLDSFILTRTDIVKNSEWDETRQQTIGYIKEPYRAYELNTTTMDNLSWGTYLIGNQIYDLNSPALTVNLNAYQTELDEWQRAADMRNGNIMESDLVLSAQFIGQEDFEGIPANHFSLDQTNLRDASDPTASYKVEEAQGDVYLAQDGNYILYFHLKLTGHAYLIPGSPGYTKGVHEMTEGLSSINQLKEITLPVEYQALELDLGGVPLPPDSILLSYKRYSCCGVDSNFYRTPLNKDGFLEFYKNLPPTDGWAVTHIGQVRNHYPCSNSDRVCIMIKKGDVQFVLFFTEGGIKADYDRENSYSPQ